MSIVLPKSDHLDAAVQRLDAAAEKLPKNPDLLGDYQKWQRFKTNPAVTILMSPAERIRFIAEMRALKEKYVK